MKNNNENSHKHLQNSEINIEQREKGTPFKVPAGYFDHLPNEINNIVNKQQTKPVIRFSLIQSVISIAAILAVVFITVWYMNDANNQVKKQQFSVTYEDIIESGMVSEYNENTLLNHYITSYSENYDDSQFDVYVDEYNDYLIQNNIDINILINEL